MSDYTDLCDGEINATGSWLEAGDMLRFDSMGRTSLSAQDAQLIALADLSSVAIETSMADNLSSSLHRLFDDVCDKTLPIYFGPLLGRLYLEGL